MRAAQIDESGKVINFVEVGGFGGLFIDPQDAVIGSVWDGEKFTHPPEPEPAPVKRHITNFAFRKRFTRTERARIEFASVDPGPTAPIEARMAAADLRATLADSAAASYKDLDRPDTRGGVLELEAAGLLDYAGRALEILDAEITEVERPL